MVTGQFWIEKTCAANGEPSSNGDRVSKDARFPFSRVINFKSPLQPDHQEIYGTSHTALMKNLAFHRAQHSDGR